MLGFEHWKVAARLPRGAVAWLALFMAAGCAPALDWRDVRVSGTELMAQLPCRPSEHARKITLGSQQFQLNLLSCSAGDATWGLAWVQAEQPQQLVDLLVGLRQAAWANLGARDAEIEPYRVPGATPQPAAGRSRLQGRRPDGSVVSQDMLLFARGLTVYQATVLASGALKPMRSDDFFGALRFAP